MIFEKEVTIKKWKKRSWLFSLVAIVLFLIPLIETPSFEVKQQDLSGSLERAVSSDRDNLVLYLSFDEVICS